MQNSDKRLQKGLVPFSFKKLLNKDKTSESYQLFESGISNQYTKRSYVMALDYFMYYSKVKRYDELNEM